MQNTIVLRTKKELDIYINPRRQELMRQMHIINRPVNAKQLSRKLHISTSAVQHHMQKLEELGVVQLHHTESIRGITARFYWAPPITVSLGRTPQSDYNNQRLALIQNALTQSFAKYSQYFLECDDAPDIAMSTMNWGIVRMEKAELKALQEIVLAFIREHEKPEAKGIPLEYVMFAYPVDGEAHA